jgi:hypothetical protein
MAAGSIISYHNVLSAVNLLVKALRQSSLGLFTGPILCATCMQIAGRSNFVFDFLWHFFFSINYRCDFVSAVDYTVRTPNQT